MHLLNRHRIRKHLEHLHGIQDTRRQVQIDTLSIRVGLRNVRIISIGDQNLGAVSGTTKRKQNLWM